MGMNTMLVLVHSVSLFVDINYYNTNLNIALAGFIFTFRHASTSSVIRCGRHMIFIVK